MVAQVEHGGREVMRCGAPTFEIVDVDDRTFTPAELVTIAGDLQTQVMRDWFPEWGNWATVIAGTFGAPISVADVQLQLHATPTAEQAGALALHDRLPDGTLIIYAFPQLCKQYGESATVAMSHEILETLGDPDLRACVQLDDGRFAALEVCDQVQADSYLIGTTLVSNFNTRANFSPPKNLPVGTKFDFMGLSKRSFETRPGGYGQVFDPQKGWVMLSPDIVTGYRAHLSALGLSRASRRMTLAKAA